jgi:hypothetical protein
LGYFLEMQSRLGAHESSSNRILLRAAARYAILPNLSAFAGGGYTPNLTPFRNEFRWWQQLQWAQNRGDHARDDLFRIRFEQRQIERTTETAYRIRFMARTLLPVFESTTKLALWDEYFYHLNTVARGPTLGFDQNRIFIGPSFLVSGDAASSLRIEPGYLNVLTHRANSASELMQHIWAVNLFWNL